MDSTPQCNTLTLLLLHPLLRPPRRRWDMVAATVTGKTKAQCLKRFKVGGQVFGWAVVGVQAASQYGGR